MRGLLRLIFGEADSIVLPAVPDREDIARRLRVLDDDSNLCRLGHKRVSPVPRRDAPQPEASPLSILVRSH